MNERKLDNKYRSFVEQMEQKIHQFLCQQLPIQVADKMDIPFLFR